MTIAVLFVSESELALANPEYKSDWIDTNKEELFEMLWEFGADINADMDFQEVTQHRNRLNQLVTCRRWATFERIDKEWVDSGYASREAKIVASGSKMLGAIRYGEITDYRNDTTPVGIATEYTDEELAEDKEKPKKKTKAKVKCEGDK